MTKNTILITIDALRKDHLSQYGYKRNTLPALDELLEDGEQIDQAYSNGSYTKVSVPSFLTSRLNGVEYIEKGPTIASELSDNGYSTLGVHSNTWLSHDFDRFYGFQEFVDFSDRQEMWSGENSDSPVSEFIQSIEEMFGESVARSDVLANIAKRIIPSNLRHSATPYVNAEKTTNEVIDWLETNSDKPFFIWIHYMDPHRPFGISSDHYVDSNFSHDEIHSLMSKAGASPEDLSESEYRDVVDLYDSDIRFLSTHISRLFRYLRKSELYSDTELILTADHGEEFGEHGMFFHRNKPYRELIDVPLFIKSDGDIVSDSAQLVDLGPTILDQHGLNVPREFEGKSLLSRDTDGVPVSIGYIGDSDYISIVDEGHQLIQEIKNEDNFELYEWSKTGINEAQNKEIREKLRQYVPKEDMILEGPNTNEINSATEERLDDLGYL